MEARIIGLPGSGKSTLLQALAETDAARDVVSVKVPDARVDALGEIFHPRKRVYAEITVRKVVFPQARGTGRRSELERYVHSLAGGELLLHVLRDFENFNLTEPPDPSRDLSQLDSEMVLGDLMLVEGILERKRKQPLDAASGAALQKAREALEEGLPLSTVDFSPEEVLHLRGFNLVTGTPQLLLVNTAEGAQASTALGEAAGKRPVLAFPFNVACEVAELPFEEQQAFAEELGLAAPAHQLVAQAAFEALGLISFLTAGEDECRAWAIRRGTLAQQAAGAVHSDIERGFIRAQVVAYDDFMQHSGSMKECREAGRVRAEGKTYEVQDGDIIDFRFSV